MSTWDKTFAWIRSAIPPSPFKMPIKETKIEPFAWTPVKETKIEPFAWTPVKETKIEPFAWTPVKETKIEPFVWTGTGFVPSVPSVSKEPEDYTHKLVVYLQFREGIDKVAFENVVKSYLSPINKIIEPLGYKFLGYMIDWSGKLTLFYRVGGSPLVTVAVLTKILILVLFAFLAVGAIVIGLSWYAREERLTSLQTDLKKLLEDGKITSEQYLKGLETQGLIQAKETIVSNLTYIILIIGVIIAVIIILQLRRK
ncbi:MAG: hypothetical protein KIH08_15760 [Candidatus Freyarchaeota archaeon]|nr:hypothetical protein [Candidatus Jordarchaeia archaeon]